MIKLFFSILGISFTQYLSAQSVQLVISNEPVLVLRNTVPARQNSITWNNHNLMYYTSGSDSAQTFIESFDAAGENSAQALFPFLAKGVWYNTSLDFLEAYNVANNSCVSFFLDDEGVFENQDTLSRLNTLQEEETAVFTIYNTEKDVYAYLEPVAGIIIEVTPHSGEIEHYIPVNLPVDKRNLAVEQLLYTDLDDSPYAIVNTTDSLVYFINNDGVVQHQLTWPVISFMPKYFGFSNGLFWMYDTDVSTWNGYALR